MNFCANPEQCPGRGKAEEAITEKFPGLKENADFLSR